MGFKCRSCDISPTPRSALILSALSKSLALARGGGERTHGASSTDHESHLNRAARTTDSAETKPSRVILHQAAVVRCSPARVEQEDGGLVFALPARNGTEDEGLVFGAPRSQCDLPAVGLLLATLTVVGRRRSEVPLGGVFCSMPPPILRISQGISLFPWVTSDQSLPFSQRFRLLHEGFVAPERPPRFAMAPDSTSSPAPRES